MTLSQQPDGPDVISLSFDFQQRSNQLYWRAWDDETDIYVNEGPAAGSLLLTANKTVTVRVSGGGAVANVSNPWHFSICDCFIITIPLIQWKDVDDRKTLSPPSPFVGSDGKTPGCAVRRVSNLQPAGFTVSQQGDYIRSNYLDRNAFTVIPSPSTAITDPIGRWDMSFVLVVDITSPTKETSTRVFRFDPETEVGNGLNNPPNGSNRDQSIDTRA